VDFHSLLNTIALEFVALRESVKELDSTKRRVKDSEARLEKMGVALN
jgi:hypothetical protein